MKKGLLMLGILLSCLAPLLAQNDTKTPDFFDVSKIHELRITLSQKNWTDVLDSMRIYGDGMVVGNISVDGVKYENVGIGYRGSGSYQTGSKRNPFQIKLNYINRDQNHQGHHAIKLSNALRDPSMVREVLGYEIIRKYMPAPRADYVQVFVNNENRGLYVNVESVDEDFLIENFNSNTNTFFKCDPDVHISISQKGCLNKVFSSLQYEDGAQCYLDNYQLLSKDGWDDLILLTKTLNNNPSEITSILNVDRTLWMLALNNVMVNLSSYSGMSSHNYYLYKDEFGRFNPIMWDLNLCFGSFKNTGFGSDLTLKALQELDPLLHEGNTQKPLISKLLQNSDFKKLYLSHVRTIFYENFENDAYLARAKDLQKMIRPVFLNDPYKYYSGQDFDKSLTNTIGPKSKIPGLAELMSARSKFLKKLPDLSVIPPVIAEVKLTYREKYSNTPITDFRIQAKVDKFPKKVKLMYRPLGEKVFREVYMVDDGSANDGESGDKVYGCIVNPEGKFDAIEFYIVAENAAMIAFDPSNYMYATRKISLKELNN